MRRDDLFVRARPSARRSAMSDAGIETRSVSTSSGATKPGLDLAHRLEGADHQARGDEQHDGERDLGDDQRVARAVPLAAGAREPAAFLERDGEVRRRELQHRNEAEEQAGERARSPSVKSRTERVDADLGELAAGPRARLATSVRMPGIREAEPDDAAGERQRRGSRRAAPTRSAAEPAPSAA